MAIRSAPTPSQAWSVLDVSALERVPLGIWSGRCGGRIVMTVLMAVMVSTIRLMHCGTTFRHVISFGVFDVRAGQGGCVPATSSAAQG